MKGFPLAGRPFIIYLPLIAGSDLTICYRNLIVLA